MWFWVTALTLLFSGIGFSLSKPGGVIVNPVYTYYVYAGRFIFGHANWFLLLFLVITGWFFWKNREVKNRLFYCVLQSIQVLVLGFLLSAFLLFFTAFVELNILAVQYNINPVSLGVITDTNQIIEKLKKFDKPPVIVVSGKGEKVEVIAVATALAGKDNFYGNFVVNHIPNFLVTNVKKTGSSILLVDDTLIVTRIDNREMEAISPVVGYLFVSSSFTNKAIRGLPEVRIMSQEEYGLHRKEIFLKKVEEISVMISQTEDKADKLEAETAANQKELETSRVLVKQIYEQQDKNFYECMNSKKTEDCQELKTAGMETVIATNKKIEELEKTIYQAEKDGEEYRSYIDFLVGQKKVGEALAENIPMERGSFDPPDKIRLTLGSTDATSVADFFATLVHEYLHYASYVSDDKKFNDPFFEEGLTEYYARRAIKNNLKINTNLGYPAAATIVAKMSNRLADSELADIFFSKDQAGLVKLLDRVYGDNFYKNNIVFFNSLQYATDQRMMLLLANTIMTKIGGEQLSAKDILSTFSVAD